MTSPSLSPLAPVEFSDLAARIAWRVLSKNKPPPLLMRAVIGLLRVWCRGQELHLLSSAYETDMGLFHSPGLVTIVTIAADGHLWERT